jgi:hypothetical protein
MRLNLQKLYGFASISAARVVVRGVIAGRTRSGLVSYENPEKAESFYETP